MLIAAATTAVTTSGTTAATSSSAGKYFFPIVLVALALLWLIVIRPKQKQQRAQRSKLADVGIGDEIITAGGLYGTVTHVGDDDVTVEIAPNVAVRLARRAIAAQLTEHELQPESESAFDAESGEEKPG